MKPLIILGVVLLYAISVNAAEPVGVIVQFNGKKAGDAAADSKDKDFQAAFEKELKAIADKLPGKPKLKVASWFTIINGNAIQWDKAEKGMPEKLKAELEQLPYVKMVELDVPTPPPGR